jgi:hypothetical protein
MMGIEGLGESVGLVMGIESLGESVGSVKLDLVSEIIDCVLKVSSGVTC